MTADDLLDMYAMGYFPMAEHREAEDIAFYAPVMRALLPLDLHIPKRLRRTASQHPFVVKVDTVFAEVIAACAAARDVTWINDDIIELYTDLHQQGFAHSVECWQDNKLVGGLYGVSIGGTFCGESMFSTVSDASKIALIHLCARLKRGGYSLLDSQFRNPHLDQFGLYEMPQEEYVSKMQSHLTDTAFFSIANYDEWTELSMFLSSNKA